MDNNNKYRYYNTGGLMRFLSSALNKFKGYLTKQTAKGRESRYQNITFYTNSSSEVSSEWSTQSEEISGDSQVFNYRYFSRSSSNNSRNVSGHLRQNH